MLGTAPKALMARVMSPMRALLESPRRARLMPKPGSCTSYLGLTADSLSVTTAAPPLALFSKKATLPEFSPKQQLGVEKMRFLKVMFLMVMGSKR